MCHFSGFWSMNGLLPHIRKVLQSIYFFPINLTLEISCEMFYKPFYHGLHDFELKSVLDFGPDTWIWGPKKIVATRREKAVIRHFPKSGLLCTFSTVLIKEYSHITSGLQLAKLSMSFSAFVDLGVSCVRPNWNWKVLGQVHCLRFFSSVTGHEYRSFNSLYCVLLFLLGISWMVRNGAPWVAYRYRIDYVSFQYSVLYSARKVVE